MSLFLHFIKWISMTGIIYFSVLSILFYLKFEPMKIEYSKYEDNMYASIIAIGVSLIMFIYKHITYNITLTLFTCYIYSFSLFSL